MLLGSRHCQNDVSLEKYVGSIDPFAVLVMVSSSLADGSVVLD